MYIVAITNVNVVRCLTMIICFRRINHMVVKNHLHSSSDVRSGRVGTVATSVKNGETGIKASKELKDLIVKIMLFNSTKTLISLTVNIR
jgi:hypothetical protein